MSIKLSDHFTYKKLLRFTLPSSFMILFTSIYTVVDGLFISNIVGETAFAAINLAWPYCFIFGAIGAVFGTGGSALVAKIKGEGDDERANKVFTLIIICMILSGLFVTFVSELFLVRVMRLLGATDVLMEDCVNYSRIFLSAQSVFILQFGMQSFLVTAERPKLGLFFTIFAGLTNIILDYLFIAVFRMGVSGAALATCLGQCVGGLGPLVYFLFSKKCPLKFVKTRFMLSEIKKTVSNGFSEGITNSAAAVVGIAYNYQLMKYIGEYGVSAYGVLLYVDFIFSSLFLGFSMASSPLFSYQYGARQGTELKNLFRKSMVLVFCFSVSSFLLSELSCRGVCRVFASYDAFFYEISVKALRLYSFNYLVFGINIFTSNFFAALNNGKIATTLSVLRIFVLQILAVMFMPVLAGVDGIWLALPVANFTMLAITFFVLRKENKVYGYY